MEKLKIAITQTGTGATNEEFIRSIFDDPALSELCTPVASDATQAPKDADALVLVSTAGPAQCPPDAIEIIVTERVCFMPLAKEPTAEDVIKFRDILERDFDCPSPRIAIVQETGMQNTELASQVTAEQGINTYGPYPVKKLLEEDAVCHFDGIITADKTSAQRIIKELALEAPVCYFAGRKEVVTAVCHPIQMNVTEDGLADVSALTHPIYTAIDVVRNRTIYDEARLNPLPKLYRDKREDRRKEDAPNASDDKEEKEQAS